MKCTDLGTSEHRCQPGSGAASLQGGGRGLGRGPSTKTLVKLAFLIPTCNFPFPSAKSTFLTSPAAALESRWPLVLPCACLHCTKCWLPEQQTNEQSPRGRSSQILLLLALGTLCLSSLFPGAWCLEPKMLTRNVLVGPCLCPAGRFSKGTWPQRYLRDVASNPQLTALAALYPRRAFHSL